MASFEMALPFIGKNEGEFQKNPNDPGNWFNGELQGTRWGISAKVARNHGYIGLMEELPKAFADAILKASYWYGLDGVNSQPIATKIFDMRVQFGDQGGMRLTQKALKSLGASLAVDGVLGPITLQAINNAFPDSLMGRLVIEMDSAYRADVAEHPAKSEFLNGWLARAAKVPSGYYIAAAGVSVLGLIVVGIAAYMLVKA
jgi:lysozyme family protein